MRLIPSTNGPRGVAWLQLVELPSELNEDGSAPFEGALAELIAEEYYHLLVNDLIRDGMIADAHTYGPAVDSTAVAIGGLVTGSDRTYARAFMNAICGLMHWVEPYDPRVVWSDPMRRCAVCSNRLGWHPQSSRTVERVGPYMQVHLTQACNGTLLDFGGWAPQKERAWWRQVDEMKAQGKWPPREHRNDVTTLENDQ